MSQKIKTFESQLNRLVGVGQKLRLAIKLDCFEDKVKEQIIDELGVKDGEKLIGSLPDFRSAYQDWYSESLALVKQVLPDRYEDFKSHYQFPRVRKEITAVNYKVADYLQGLSRQRHGGNIIVDGSAAILEFEQQLNIVLAARNTLHSALINLTLILQADLYDSEVDSARALAKSGFLRAAGAICGVVLEKHLKQVCESHGITIRKKNPGISDLNQTLKEENAIDVPEWRFVQHLADIRNICDHAKDVEPTKDQVDDLIGGVNKVLKTVF